MAWCRRAKAKGEANRAGGGSFHLDLDLEFSASAHLGPHFLSDGNHFGLLFTLAVIGLKQEMWLKIGRETAEKQSAEGFGIIAPGVESAADGTCRGHISRFSLGNHNVQKKNGKAVMISASSHEACFRGDARSMALV